MITIFISNEKLDTPESLSFTFTRSNSLYDFDSVSVERSSTFNVPKTQRNARLLTLSDNIHADGAAMRQRSAALVFVDGVQSSGYLYVTRYNGSEFECVLIVGENLAFKKLKEAGTIAEVVTGVTDKTTKYVVGSLSYEQNNNDQALIGNYDYKRNIQDVVPAINLFRLHEKAVSRLGISIESMPESVQSLIPRWLPAERVEDKGIFSASLTTTKGVPTDTTINTTSSSVTSIIVPAQVTFWRNDYKCMADNDGVKYWYFVRRKSEGYSIAGWSASQDIYITFPDTDELGHIYIVGDGVFAYNTDTRVAEGLAYLDGDADPVRGRTVYLARGTKFVLIDGNDYHMLNANDYAVNVEVDGSAGKGVDGLYFNGDGRYYYVDYGQPSATYNIAYSLAVNDYAQSYIDTMDISVLDLTKIMSAIGGYSLYVNGAGKICFFNFSNWGNTVDLTGRVTRWQEVCRKFKDYGQHNLLKFADADSVTDGERTTIDYEVANDYLTGSNVLLEIPYSEGKRYDADKQLFVKYDTDGKAEADIVMLYDDSTMNLTQGQVVRNNTLAGIVSTSVYVKVQALMSYMVYTQVQATTRLRIDTDLYTWTAIQWQDGVATLELQKLP